MLLESVTIPLRYELRNKFSFQIDVQPIGKPFKESHVKYTMWKLTSIDTIGN